MENDILENFIVPHATFEVAGIDEGVIKTKLVMTTRSVSEKEFNKQKDKISEEFDIYRIRITDGSWKEINNKELLCIDHNQLYQL